MRKAIAATFVVLAATFGMTGPALARGGGGGGGGGGHASSSSGGSHSSGPSYSGSRSGTSGGSRAGSGAPTYSGSHSSSSRGSNTRAPSYSGSRSSNPAASTRTVSSGGRTVSVHVYTVPVLPGHPTYGYLYSGHYYHAGVYYPYYYDGGYYSTYPTGAIMAANRSSGHGWAVFFLVLVILAVIGLLVFLFVRPRLRRT